MVGVNGVNYGISNNYINFKSNLNTTNPQNQNYGLNNLRNSSFNNIAPQGDIFVSSKKVPKEEKNNKLLWGVGAAALGIGALAYVFSKGKINSKSAHQLAENIQFTPAKTVEEAKQFAKDKLGVCMVDGLSLDVLNYTNEGLCQLKNKYPKDFVIKWVESSPIEMYNDGSIAQGLSLDTYKNCFGIRLNSNFIRNIDNEITDVIISFAPKGELLMDSSGKLQYSDFFKKADISGDITELINKFKSKPSSLSFTEKMKLFQGMNDIDEVMMNLYTKHGGDISKLPDSIKIVSSPFHTLPHEQGHFLHRMNVGAKKFELLDCMDTLRQKKLDTTITKEFKDKYSSIAKRVSDYAQESPAEFVAEVYAKTLNGAKFDNDVMKLYSKYGGMPIPA